MNVVRHQAIGDDLNAALARALAQEIKIGNPVAGRVENPLAPVSALRHVMGKAGKHDARLSRHASTVAVADDARVANIFANETKG
jgi:hypothetical protein